ncbi:MAG: hypothetical protein MZU97_18910 [Bacillus subtilis]|nr:hypothetical protein [Bacillus subtilis]
MKRWLPVLCIALLMTLLPGASAWEGSAMMSAYGEFPESGYYAACNSFPTEHGRGGREPGERKDRDGHRYERPG